MPIYAYKCESCGLSKDVLQKMSDDALSTCPSCGQPTFVKQLTAAGFQLKGSGWYATDFKGGSTSAPATEAKTEAPSQAPAPASAPAPAKADAAPSASAGGCGSSCACH